jgi:hypothetical protein
MESVSTTVSGTESRGTNLIGIFGVLTGIWIVISLGVDFATPSPSSSLNALSTYQSNVDLFWASLATTVVVVAVAIAFIAGMLQLLSPRSPTVSRASLFLLVAGAVVVVVGEAIEIVGMWAVTQGPTGGTTYGPIAIAQAAFAYNLGTVVLFAFPFLGAGLILLAWVSWRSDLFPRWLSVVAAVGGIGGLVALVDPTTFVGRTLWLAALAVTGFFVGYKLLRGPPAPSGADRAAKG